MVEAELRPEFEFGAPFGTITSRTLPEKLCFLAILSGICNQRVVAGLWRHMMLSFKLRGRFTTGQLVRLIGVLAAMLCLWFQLR